MDASNRKNGLRCFYFRGKNMYDPDFDNSFMIDRRQKVRVRIEDGKYFAEYEHGGNTYRCCVARVNAMTTENLRALTQMAVYGQIKRREEKKNALRCDLMRKGEKITAVEFSPQGRLLWFDREQLHRHLDLAPFELRARGVSLSRWWRERAIPESQDGVKAYLAKNGCTSPSAYLLQNLGLSLTDYYWVRPADSDLAWETVNPYDHPFVQNRFDLDAGSSDRGEVLAWSPNGSLQGQLEKTWAVMDGKRYLVKGNPGAASYESLNEVFAARIHALQGCGNYTSYQLISIRNRPYAFGCRAELFTGQDRELVSAYAVLRTGKKRNDQSFRECLIETLGEYGMDQELLRHDLDYLAMTDFLISEYDRHLNNIAFLKDAKTLRFLRMAPVFDSGGSLYAGRAFPHSESELLRLRTNGFHSREEALIKSVRDYHCVDLTRLPPASVLRALYEKDSGIRDAVIRSVCEVYEKKIDLCRQLQLGIHIYARIAMRG